MSLVTNKRLSKNGLNLWPTDACLITHLINDLAGLTPKSLEKTCLILPTGRLGTLVLASLAKAKHGAFVPPDVHTLESWLDTIAAQRPDRQRRISDAAFHLLLSQILESSGYGYLRAAHEAELSLLFKELEQQELDEATAFVALREAWLEASNRHESFLQSCLERLDEIADCFSKLRERLNALGMVSSTQNADAAYVTQQPEALNAFHYERVIIVGFTSAVPAMRRLLADLAKRDGVEVWLSNSPAMLASVNPLQELTDSFDSHHDVVVPPLPQRDDRPRISPCATKLSEVKTALDSCKRAIDCGIAPSRVAILVSNEQDYVDLIHAYGERSGLPLNIALSRGLHLYPIGSWLSLLTTVLQEQDVASLLRWLLHPYTKRWLCSVLNTSSGTIDSEIGQAVNHLAGEFDTKIFGHKTRLHQLSFTQTATWRAAFKFVAGLYDQKSKQSWDACISIITNDVLAPIRSLASGVLKEETDLKHCLEALDLYLQSLTPIAKTFASLTSLTTVLGVVKKNLASVDVRHIGEPLYGVQVLSLAESRYYPLEHVVLIGANEGLFPKGMPQDELLDDYSKRILGLPGWQSLEAREDVSFSLLHARIPNLHLIYAQDRLGEDLHPSRYIELFAAKGHLIHLQPNIDVYPTLQAPDEPSTAGFVDRAFAQKTWLRFSASSLEALLQCPYRFLLLRNGVSPYPLPRPWRDVRDEGEWLHEVFEHFMKDYAKVVRSKTNEEPLDIMKRLTQKFGPDGVSSTALYHHLCHFAFPRFLSYLQKLYARDGLTTITRGKRELFFGSQDAAMHAQLDDVIDAAIELHGKVDSVDFLEGLTLILDYKRKTLPRKDLAKSGASPQLSFYALALSKSSSKAHGIGERQLAEIATAYWSILDGELQVAAAGTTAVAKAAELGLCSTRTTDLEEVVSRMRSLWQWRLNTLAEDTTFRPDTSECGLCAYGNVCRKADARHEAAFLGRRALRGRLALGTVADSDEV